MSGLKLGAATRDAYGETLLDLGRAHPDIVVVDADLSKSTKTCRFGEAFPERFFNVGIAEANAVSIACGLAAGGLVPFVSSFAVFLMTKGLDQLRMGVAYSQHNVKIVTSHGGISVGEDGPSQQSIEDLALALSLPQIAVLVPADAWATQALVRQAYHHPGAVYIRTGRPKAPLIHQAETRFKIGGWHWVADGSDVAIVACGLLVAEALAAREKLALEGIRAAVVDAYSLRPYDAEVLDRAIGLGALVTAEEHLLDGGLAGLVCRAVCQRRPVPVETVGINNTYAESGKQEELFERYGLSAGAIVAAARRAVARKPAPLKIPVGRNGHVHLA